MPRVRVHNFSVSLDGFGTGDGQSLDAPFGHAGVRLHEWFFPTRTFRAMQGQPGGSTGIDDAFASAWGPGIGAEIMGRGKFGPHHGPWPEQEWNGWWGDNPPFGTPVFVLTHHPRPAVRMDGGTTFHFLDASPAHALAQAREAAAGGDIRIGGGPSTIREFLAAGLIDYLHIVVVPIVLGRGERLWDGLEALEDHFQIEAVSSPSGVTHVTFSRRLSRESPMGMLDGKVAFITGGARGQGRAHAVTCAREGADVIIVDVIDQLPTVRYKLATRDDLDETVRLVEAHDRRAIAVPADVRIQDQLDAAVAAGLAELGKIDILIANAGIWTLGSFWELTDEQWDEMIGVNLTGVWKSAKAVAPHMIERRSGSIVITASVNALEAGQYTAHYVAAKHGLIGLMRNVALELAPYGIRCNAVCPGAVKTPMTNHQDAWDMFAGHPGGTEEDMTEAGHHYTLLAGASWLDPQDVANAALYLNSDLASRVTGATVPVDAGHLTLSGYNPLSTR